MTEQHQVAVVVFTTVEATDLLDATHIAERAVRDALIHQDTTPLMDGGVTLTASFPGDKNRTAVTTCIREIGMAMRNGYLWAMPTSKTLAREDDE